MGIHRVIQSLKIITILSAIIFITACGGGGGVSATCHWGSSSWDDCNWK